MFEALLCDKDMLHGIVVFHAVARICTLSFDNSALLGCYALNRATATFGHINCEIDMTNEAQRVALLRLQRAFAFVHA